MVLARPIHPFPARMAAEIALEVLARLPAGSRVLDPMAGSGTVLRAALAHGHTALGFDTDPLAVLMARVWTTPLDPLAFRRAASDLAAEAAGRIDDPSLPWLDDDRETHDFAQFWFGEPQRRDLRRLAAALCRYADGDPIGDALKLALSRIIITKDRGASLARDVSHSRPHRAFAAHDFAVVPAFLRAAGRIAAALERDPPSPGASVRRGDARHLEMVAAGSIDAAITSPPYLNAIDYLRGHRLALVWLGHRLGDLRAIRAANIGSERAPAPGDDGPEASWASAQQALASAGTGALPARQGRMVERYARDLAAFLAELARVLCPGGSAVLVVGNSCLRGTFIANDRLLIAAAEGLGFRTADRQERTIPAARRYLPPPASDAPALAKRMRTESVVTLVRP